MDQLVASEPTPMRDGALLIGGLIHVQHQISRLSFTKGFSPCQRVLGMHPDSRLGNSAYALSPVSLDAHAHRHHLSRTHGVENCSHDSVCQGRLVSFTQSSPVAQPFQAHDRPCGWTALPPLEGRQSGKTPAGVVKRTTHRYSQRADLRWQDVGVLACSWRVSASLQPPLAPRPDFADVVLARSKLAVARTTRASQRTDFCVTAAAVRGHVGRRSP